MANFAELEERKLNGVVATFTESDRAKYGEEVDYIKSLLELLKQQEEDASKTKDSKDKKKKEKEADKTKKKVEDGFNNLINSYTLKKLGNVTHKLVPEESMDNAKLVKASQIYNRSGKAEAEAYLKNQDLDNWKIDDLSSKQVLVLKDGERIKLAARGTDLQGKNLNDFDYDVKAHFGAEQQHNILVDARKQIKAVKQKYPNIEIEQGLGYSLGSNVMLNMGREFGFKTESFNPYITKNIVNDANKYTGNENILNRTTDDLPSIRGSFLDGIGDYEVRTMPVLENSMNPIKAHRLENFTTNNRSGKESALQTKMREAAEASSRHGELDVFSKMVHRKNPKPRVRRLSIIERPDGTLFDPNKKRVTIDDDGDPLIDRRLQPKPDSSRTDYDFSKVNSRDGNSVKMSEMNAKPFTHESNFLGLDEQTWTEMQQLEHAGKVAGNVHPSMSEAHVNLAQRQVPSFDIREPDMNMEKREIFEPDGSKRTIYTQKRQVGRIPKGITGSEVFSNQNIQPNMFDKLAPAEREQFKSSTPFELDPRQADYWKNKRERLQERLNQRQSRQMSVEPSDGLSLADEIAQVDNTGFGRKLNRNKTISPEDKNLLLKKRSKIKLPDGDISKSKKLESQIDNLEDAIVTPSEPESQPQASEQSFTEFAKDTGITPSNYQKTLWKKAGGDLTDEEQQGFSEENTINDRDSLDEYLNSDNDGRREQYKDSFEDMKSSVAAVDEFVNTPVRGDNVSRLGNVARETFKGIHPVNLGVGIVADQLSNTILDYFDSEHKQPEVLRVGETGILSGGIAAGLTGGSLLPEAAAGGAAYLAGTYTAKGVTAGLEGLGVNENIAGGIGAVTGGGVGGATAVGVGSLISSILGGAGAGAEEGAVAGGGVFSAETAAIGALVGGTIGLGSYLYQKLKKK